MEQVKSLSHCQIERGNSRQRMRRDNGGRLSHSSVEDAVMAKERRAKLV